MKIEGINFKHRQAEFGGKIVFSQFEAKSNRAPFLGRRLNVFVGLSLNDRTILFLVILVDKTVSVG